MRIHIPSERRVRIALAAGFALLLGLVVAVPLLTRGDGEVVAGHTTNPDQVWAWDWSLKQSKVQHRITRHDDEYRLYVSSKVASGVDLSIKATAKSPISTAGACPKVSTWAGSSERNDASACRMQAEIHDTLVAYNGILETHPVVRVPDFNAEDDTTRATVQVWRDPRAPLRVAPSTLAQAVANIIGGSTKDVVITDTRGDQLWPAEATRSTRGADACAVELPGIDEIAGRERVLEGCLEQKIGRTVQAMLGLASEQVSVFAPVTIDPRSRHTSRHVVDDGTALTRSVTNTVGKDDKGNVTSDNRQVTTTSQPTTRDVEEQVAAGVLSSQNISVTLRGATEAQRSIVERQLRNAYPRSNVSVLRAPALTATDAPAPAAGATRPRGARDLQRLAPRERAPLLTRRQLVSLGAIVLALLLVGASMQLRSMQARRDVRRLASGALDRDLFAFNHSVARAPDQLARELESWLGPPMRGRPATGTYPQPAAAIAVDAAATAAPATVPDQLGWTPQPTPAGAVSGAGASWSPAPSWAIPAGSLVT